MTGLARFPLAQTLSFYFHHTDLLCLTHSYKLFLLHRTYV